MISWARRHEFERHYQRVRAERERAALHLAEDYLTRAFSLILSRQQETLFDLDAEIEAGVASASGRLAPGRDWTGPAWRRSATVASARSVGPATSSGDRCGFSPEPSCFPLATPPRVTKVLGAGAPSTPAARSSRSP